MWKQRLFLKDEKCHSSCKSKDQRHLFLHPTLIPVAKLSQVPEPPLSSGKQRAHSQHFHPNAESPAEFPTPAGSTLQAAAAWQESLVQPRLTWGLSPPEKHLPCATTAPNPLRNTKLLFITCPIQKSGSALKILLPFPLQKYVSEKNTMNLQSTRLSLINL